MSNPNLSDPAEKPAAPDEHVEEPIAISGEAPQAQSDLPAEPLPSDPVEKPAASDEHVNEPVAIAGEAALTQSDLPADPSPSVSGNSEEISFEDLLTEFEQQHRDLKHGESLQGTVIAVNQDSVLVDIGRKTEGVLPASEFLDDSGNLTIKKGDALIVSVTGRGQGGYYQLSTTKVRRPTDWSSLEKAYADGSTIGGTVKEVIKGGLSVDVGARAFLPASRSGAKDAAAMDALVGQEIRCKIIKLDTANDDVVLDCRAVLEAEAAAARERLFSELEVGAVVSGKVRSLTKFGAFVDLGGIDGLLHVADMAWNRVSNPSSLLAEGDSVEVKILKVDPETRRISLGMKQLVPDPWSLAAEKYTTGEKVTGKVVRLTDFGAFVELEAGVDGLIHVSEMSWTNRNQKPSEILKRGETVEVVVLSVKPDERRIGLGLKQALGDPWEDIEKRFPVGSVAEGKVSNLAKFGAFVELGDGIEGMIHIGDITREKHLNHPSEELSAGQEIRAAVLEIDRKRKRLRLGMKQLQPTSADEYIAEHSIGDVVTGRIIKSSPGHARVELGEGVTATCRLKKEGTDAAAESKDSSTPDLSALTAMLAAKWKQGSGNPAGKGTETLSLGEIRSFRITSLDPEKKNIDLELAE